MEGSIDCKIGNFQTEGNVIMLHKHLGKSVVIDSIDLAFTNSNLKIINQHRL